SLLSCCLSWPAAFSLFLLFFFFHATATAEIYTLSLHDALPILGLARAYGMLFTLLTAIALLVWQPAHAQLRVDISGTGATQYPRSEEHTSELQSRENLVCRLLLEKKKDTKDTQSALPQYSSAKQ